MAETHLGLFCLVKRRPVNAPMWKVDQMQNSMIKRDGTVPNLGNTIFKDPFVNEFI